MRIILIGANGTIGKHVTNMLESEKHTVVKVGRKSGDFQVNIEDPESLENLFKKVGSFDAVVNVSGEVAFAPLQNITHDHLSLSIRSKLLGQIQLVLSALPYIQENGSFTLVSGILGDEQILAGSLASMVNSAIEGFVKGAACELPKNLGINVVSPTVLTDSLSQYGDFFPGFRPVEGKVVAQAFKKAIFGIQTGQIIKAL